MQVSWQPNPPNTSGTYSFAPSMGETVLYAYGLCGIRRTELIQAHFEDARMATNLMMAAWSSRGVNLWQVQLNTINLVQGQATYQIPANTIVMLDAYITQNSGPSSIDLIILPISRTEYASYSNKTQQGRPTTYWMDRLLAPTVTLWPTPNATSTVFNYYCLRQTQDSILAGGANVEVPIYWLEPYALGLAWRLALSWAPDKALALKPLADEAYNYAATQNVESAQFYISPQIGGYFR